MALSTRNLFITLILLALAGAGFTALTKYDPARAVKSSAEERLLKKARFSLLKHEDGQLLIEWECPDIHVESDSATGRVTGIGIDGAPSCHEVGVPRLPVLSQMLDCLPGGVHVEIVEADVDTRTLGPMAAAPEDFVVDERPTGDDENAQGSLDEPAQRLSYRERSALTPLKEGLWPPQMVSLNEAGVFRGHRLLAVRFYPVQVDAGQGLARVARRVKVRVTIPRAETTAERLPDQPSETELVRKMLGPLASTALPSRMREAYQGHGSLDEPLDDEPIGGRWKLTVRETGIVRVSYADLVMAGCPVDQITTWDLHIKNRGHDIPIYFVGEADGRFDEHDYLLFYGEPNLRTYVSYSSALYQDPWTTQNVYWLSWGDGVPGLRLGEEDMTYQASWPRWTLRTATFVRSKVRFEKDLRFDRLAMSYLQWTSRLQSLGPLGVYEDHYFYGDRIDALSSRDFPVSIPFPYTLSLRPVKVRVALQGSSYPGVFTTGEHRAVIYVNDQTSPGLAVGRVAPNDGNITWQGQTAVIIESRDTPTGEGIVTSDLQAGMNTISVTLPGDGMGGTSDKIFANWFEIEYDRELKASGGFITFTLDTTRGDTFTFEIRGFANQNIQVWRIGQSRLTNSETRYVHPGDEGPTWAARFNLISDRPSDFLLFDERYPKPPLYITPETSTRDLRTLPGAEYLIIYHDLFANDLSLLRLDSLRRASFNGSVDTFRVSQIYEQFNYGIVNPEAIHTFLKYAYEHWTVRPTHVCLIGDALLMNRERDQSGYLIPSLYPVTQDFGISASDGLLGDVSGPPWDIIPDIAVGRISCRTPGELQTYVEKLVRYDDPYQTAYNTPYHATALFVSDSKDGQFNFDADYSEPTAALLPSNVILSRLCLDSLPPMAGPNALREALRTGAVLVNYNGHGGGGVWSGTELINVSGVRLLTNHRALPFITNFTCYVGAFDDKNQSAVLGEAFLFSRNIAGNSVGAIGAYSSSGVGWAIAGRIMQQYLYDFVWQPPGLTIGEIVQMNRGRFWAVSGSAPLQCTSIYSQDVMMCLLGDPGVRMRLPEQEWSDFVPNTNIVHAGDTLYVSGSLPFDPQGRYVDLYFLPYNDHLDQQWWDPISHVWIPLMRTHVPAFDFENVFPTSVNTSSFSNLPVPLTPQGRYRFVAPQGRVVVYLADPGVLGQSPPRDAIGSFPIYLADSLSELRVANVRVVPGGYIYCDSTFIIQANIAHQSGLEWVKARGVFRPAQGPVVLDTVNMVQVEAGLWQTPLLGPYQVFGGSYRVLFTAKPVGGDATSSESYNLRLEQRPDIQISASLVIHPVPQPGRQPLFYAPVIMYDVAGTRHVSELTVQLHAMSYSYQGPDTTTVDSFTTRVVVPEPASLGTLFETWLPAPFRPLLYSVAITADPDNVIPELWENNNTYSVAGLHFSNLYPATNALGSYLPRSEPPVNDDHVYWSWSTHDSIWLKLLPGSLPVDSTTLIYLGPTSLDSISMARIGPYVSWPRVKTSLATWRVTLADSSEQLAPAGSAEVMMTITGMRDTLALHDLSLFVKRRESPAWVKMSDISIERLRVDTVWVIQPPPTPPQPVYSYSARVRGRTHSLGQFAAFLFADDRGPTIELTADGVRFTPHSILPRRPQIYASLTDYSGIDRGPGKFYMTLDGDTVPSDEIVWTDTLQSGGSMSAIFRPELEPGLHTITVKATDNSGLSDSTVVQFEVRGTFGFEWAINYPNPFSRSTTIAYVLTDVTDQLVEVRIFSVSGRPIRTLHETEQAVANYREILWNGKDEDGDEVANGVYFARIKAKQGTHEVEKIVKMAKVR
jgi:hypothetical protein